MIQFICTLEASFFWFLFWGYIWRRAYDTTTFTKMTFKIHIRTIISAQARIKMKNYPPRIKLVVLSRGAIHMSCRCLVPRMILDTRRPRTPI